MIKRLGRVLYVLGCVSAGGFLITLFFVLTYNEDYGMNAIVIAGFTGVSFVCWFAGRSARYILSNE